MLGLGFVLRCIAIACQGIALVRMRIYVNKDNATTSDVVGFAAIAIILSSGSGTCYLTYGHCDQKQKKKRKKKDCGVIAFIVRYSINIAGPSYTHRHAHIHTHIYTYLQNAG
jgi:hypothetical protein